jgi:hypothetical protein
MPNDTTYAEELQDHSNAPRLCPDVLNADNYTYCHWAKTVVGWDINAEQWVAVGVSCKRWGCAYCANRKIRRLAWLSRNAEPTRLLTLTVSSHLYQTPEIAWLHTSKAFPELIRYSRKTFGDTEYLRVLELQANGMPHYHCMLRSPFIPHGPFLAEWRRLLGEPENGDGFNWSPGEEKSRKQQWAGVNIKKIDSTFRTFRYLVKYLTKLHKIPWTDRHVSYSKDFFREEDKEDTEYAKLDRITRYDDHPWVWLRERCDWSTVGVIGEGKWLLGDDIPELQMNGQGEVIRVDPTSIGLPGPNPVTPAAPLSQRLVPGMEDVGKEDESSNLRPDGRKKTRRPRSS